MSALTKERDEPSRTAPIPPLRLRVFLSSPGDVTDERNLARKVLKEELPYRPFLRDRVTFDVVSWDDPAARIPMLANLTPQESVNRGNPKPSACHVVVVVLWGRMGTPLPPEIRRTVPVPSLDRTPWAERYLSGTEWEYEDAANADPKPEVLVYRRSPGPSFNGDDPNLKDNLEQYERVKQFFARFTNPDGSPRGGYTTYDMETAFERRLAADIEALVARRLEATAAPETVSTAAEQAAPPWQGSPYPGLRAFTFEEAAIFFGRGREVDRLMARLRDPGQRFLCVVGASGTGKSSLVRAGLLPRVLAGGIEGGERWRVLTFTPGATGDDPFLALAVELGASLPAAGREPPREIAKALAAEPGRIADYAARILADEPDGARLVLFADQLEELFTLVDWKHEAGFIDLLARATADERLRVLATLRADFFAQATAPPTLAMLLQGAFPLSPPDQVALNDMIRRPAERAGLTLQDGLAEAILADAGHDPGGLPLVAFCLEVLYRESPPTRALTLDAYGKLGGLEGAIGRVAEAAVAKLSDGACAKLPTVFQWVVHLDGDGTPTRRRASWSEFGDDPEVRDLVGALIDARLLRSDRPGSTAADAMVEVAHEAVFPGWPQLSEWLRANQPDLLAREDIRMALRRWQRDGRDPSDLLPIGKRLDEALRLADERPDLLDDEMAAFIAASRERAVSAEQEAEDRRRREALRLVALAEQETAAGNAVKGMLLTLEALKGAIDG